MNRYTPIRIPVKVFRLLTVLGLLSLACCFFYGRTVHATISTGPSDLVQFTASGHILGFESEGVYVASSGHVLRVEFAGTDGVKPMADRIPTSDGHAQPLGRVDYPELWPGISLGYEAVSGGIVQSSYILEPGADVGQIRLRYNASVEIEAGGSLRIGSKSGWMNESAPVAWQEIDGQRIPVAVAFHLYDSSIKNSMVGFSLGQYNPAYLLMIDPTLSWNTFIGSASDDYARAIAVDGSGNVYVAGQSGAAWGSPVSPFGGEGDPDAFAAKLNSSGVLQWNTFIGSADLDTATAIAVDGSGNVYVAGRSDATWGSPVSSYEGGDYPDAFVAKLNSSGVLQWNTFMGSEAIDHARAIAVDGSENVYVAGRSDATWGSPVNAYTGSYDAFVAKLNSSGVLQWNTFMGSESGDLPDDIAVDGSGNVYVAGQSYATWGSPVNASTGSTDAFAAKLNSSGVLQWNTFMGSGMGDFATAIALDGSGNVCVAGVSYYTWGSPVNAHAGSRDAFAAKLNSSGVLQWNTFMGSEAWDDANAITVDGSGNVYVAGLSYATWGSPLNAYVGGVGLNDAFAAKLNSSGVLQWNTFMGSESVDIAYAIAVDSRWNVYVAGYSYAAWGSPLNAYSGLNDAFVAQISDGMIKGDINGMDGVNLSDAIIALQALSKLEISEPLYTQADVDGDGNIGLEDVIYILLEVSELR